MNRISYGIVVIVDGPANSQNQYQKKRMMVSRENFDFNLRLKARVKKYSCLMNLLCSQVQDAQVAMKLYTLHRKQWERQLKEAKFKYSTKQHATKQDRQIAGCYGFGLQVCATGTPFVSPVSALVWATNALGRFLIAVFLRLRSRVVYDDCRW